SFQRFDKKLIASIPYAHAALNLVRKISPLLGKTILIAGQDPASIISAQISSIGGANVILYARGETEFNFNNTFDGLDITILKDVKDLHDGELLDIDNIIINEQTPEIVEVLSKLHENVIDRTIISTTWSFDKHETKILHEMGFTLLNINLFSNYLKSFQKQVKVYQPIGHIRWNFKTNMEYFIDLIEDNKVNLDFFNIETVQLDHLKDLKEAIRQDMKKSIYLFEID
ncbi:MAG: hypothetical protein ACTSRA_18190, partial [Promethearchaeota archaeon]